MITIQVTDKITNDKVYQDSLIIREQVFIEEQNIPPEVEIADEENCLYFVLYVDQNAVATCRLAPISSTKVKLQRMAVLSDFRKQQLGKQLLQKTVQEAKRLGYQEILLGAQNTAIIFYQKLGFSIVGNEFFEGGLPHHNMQKQL